MRVIVPLAEARAVDVMSQAIFLRGIDQEAALAELVRRGIAMVPEQRIRAGLAAQPSLHRLADFVADRVGAPRWIVAHRLTDLHRLQGYTLAISTERYRQIAEEHRLYMIDAVRPARAPRVRRQRFDPTRRTPR